MGPAPPFGSGLHRYVFLLYKQPANQEFAPLGNRPNFKAAKWATDYGMTLVGANFYMVERKA